MLFSNVFPSVKTWVRIMNDVCPRVQFFTSQHWFGTWLATVSVTSYYLNACWQNSLSLKMPSAWRRPFCHKFNQNITTNISHNINLFQTQKNETILTEKIGKGRDMILVISRKGRHMVLIRAQLDWEKILLIADRAQIDRLLVLWRAWRAGRLWQERE